jgi:group I intron endonuclease
MISGIYCIINDVNDKIYIGSSVHVYVRLGQHKRDLKLGQHHSPILQAAWNKYGENAFVMELVEEVRVARLRCVEQRYIETLHPEYNIALDTTSPMRGRKQSAEHIAKRANAKRGKPLSLETKLKIAATLRGRKLGPRTQEVRNKISQSLNGHSVSKTTRAKIGSANLGFIHTDETKKQIGIASSLRMAGNQIWLGKKHTDATREKLRQRRRAYFERIK